VILFPDWGSGDVRPARVQITALENLELIEPIVRVVFIVQSRRLEPVAEGTVVGAVKTVLDALSVTSITGLEPALVHHPPEPVQAGVLIPSVTDRLSSLFDVRQFDPWLVIHSPDNLAPPKIAVAD